MPIPFFEPGTDILGAMITPAVLISASGTLGLATSNRLGRVVDRIRALHEVTQKLETDVTPDQYAEEKRELIADQVTELMNRLWLLQNAITMIYTAIGLYVASSIAIGLTVTWRGEKGTWPAALGLIGAIVMFYGIVLLVRETRVAVRSSVVEVRYVMRGVERMKAMRNGPT